MPPSSSPKERRPRILPQILIPTLSLLLVSNLLILITTYTVLDSELRTRDASLLLGETRQVADRIDTAIEQLKIDIRQASTFPAVEEVVRAANNGLSTTETRLWEDRVAQLFTGMLKANPALSQARLIDATGQEVVRVDRYGDSKRIRRVAQGNLQNKQDRPYFQSAMAMPPGQVFLSDIDLNQENNQIVEPRELVIRGAMPLFADGGSTQAFGIIILNVGMDSMLQSLPQLVAPNHSITVANSHGQYLFHSSRPIAITHADAGDANFFSDTQRKSRTAHRSASPVFTHNGKTIAIVPVQYGSAQHPQQLQVAAEGQISDSLAVRNKVIERSAIILAGLLLFSVALSVYMSRRISRPIADVTERIQRGERSQLSETISRSAPQEFYQLASSLDEAYQQLTLQQSALEQEVHARQTAQLSLEDKVEQLSRANQELKQFTYIASHDLQEPLRTIRSFIELLMQHHANGLSDNARTMMQFVEDASARMQTLVKDLLDYGRIGTKSETKLLDMNLLVAAVLEDLSSAIQDSGATVTLGKLPALQGFETELRLLFQNLLSNALKFSRPEVAPVIHVSASRQGSGWQFQVCDNGIGIEPQYRDKIFGVFKRLHTKQEYPGTGIGLAHCQKVVALHQGKIWVESAEPCGSCFVFTLKEPRHEDPEQSATGG